MKELELLQAEIGKWSDETFGADRGPEGAINHLKQECDEILEDPDDLVEYADALHLVLDAARRAGFSTRELMDAAWNKLDINKTREWGEVDENGVSNHL